jgi:membrane-associated phospholipid phosphatase
VTIRTLHPRRPWLIPAALLFGGLALFIAVALDVTHNGKLVQFDRAVAPYLYERANGWLILLASCISGLGNFAVVAPCAIFGGLWLGWRRRWRAMAVWAAAFVGSAVICDTLKSYFHIPRPARYHNYVFDPVNPGFTFPSGHTMAVTIGAGITVVVLIHLVYRPPRVRWCLAAAAAGLGTLVAASLVYVGVHYVTDVLGGLAISAAWVGVLSALLPAKNAPSRIDSPGIATAPAEEISTPGG